MHSYVYTRVYIYMSAFLHVYIYAYVPVFGVDCVFGVRIPQILTCAYVCVHALMYVLCMCTHSYVYLCR